VQYSDTWFELFVHTIDPAQTQREIEFLARQLPPPRFKRILDVCCGTGRHAVPLAQRGYEVLGIDCNNTALERARAAAVAVVAAAGNRPAEFRPLDMQCIEQIDRRFDAVILLWQSFGQFDERTNRDVLRQVAQALEPEGRFVIDLYHREFFVSRLATRRHERGGRTIVEHKRMDGERLTVQLDYGDGTQDILQWQLFTPEEMSALMRSLGMKQILACSEFNEQEPPTNDRPRVQYVFEKRDARTAGEATRRG
jgi:SAM-dependent methyltransferase